MGNGGTSVPLRVPSPRPQVVHALAERLAAAADERTRAWWERYLTGAVPFRGVPMAGIRAAVRGVWAEQVADVPVGEQLEVAFGLFAEPYCEDKLAGVLALAELLLDDLSLDDVPGSPPPSPRVMSRTGTPATGTA